MTSQKVYLIPWDPSSEEQYQRMQDQRLSCGLRVDEVPAWKDKHLKGVKTMYWVVLSDGFADKDKLLAEHAAKYPLEAEPITDTADTVANSPRTSTGAKFIPIGHMGVEQCPELVPRLGIPESTLRVKSLYVSWILQAGGFGRGAMAEIERLSQLPPHNATAMILDTMQKEFQLSETFMRLTYDVKGLERPENPRTNQEWYARQGYEVVPLDEDEVYSWKEPISGEVADIPIVYLKKTLVK